MLFSFLRMRYTRCGRLMFLLMGCALIIITILTLEKFSSSQFRSRKTSGISQNDVDYFAENIEVKFRVVQNDPQSRGHFFSTEDDRELFEAEITLINRGDKVFPKFGWSIFFNQILGLEPVFFPHQSVAPKPVQGVQFRHWNGQLYSVEPTKTFSDLNPGETKVIRYYSNCCSVTFTDVMPNWYLVFSDLEPRIIKSTQGEPDKFVAPFNSAKVWKRIPDKLKHNYDLYNPPNVSERFATQGVKDLGHAPIPVIPTPKNIVQFNPSSTLNVLTGGWVIVSNSLFHTAVTALKEKWKLDQSDSLPQNKYVELIYVDIPATSNNRPLPINETYELSVSPAKESITVKASDAAGAFYAIQSLFSLTDKEGNVPETKITDGPRYRYRGLMIDVARNFHRKETIMKYIEAMAMYKLNKLHFHLTDDEGWRLEIPGLPELTEIGGRRCHDPSEQVCILPFLGSGPQPVAPGSGFYTVEDYKEILLHAVAHHVEIIPEIDMPAHSHAAIKAMEARFIKYASSDPSKATRYLLSDLQDTSQYASVQSFKDGAVNPCLQSTYAFLEKVMKTLIDIHRDISPLQTFHYGGDEVPRTAWLDSPLCKELNATRINKSLKQVFAESVSKIAARHNLNLAAWEDGLMNEENPMPRTQFSQKNIYVYAWNNLWGLRQAKRAYTFANSGYKVVLTPATNAYLDHPYEPDPTERGLIWATRFISTQKVFLIAPENIYTSEGTTMNGLPIPECSPNTEYTQCPELQEKDNIEGIQGSLFGELIRAEWIMDFMVFPRMLALAERAWHAAPWENEPSKIKKEADMKEDWVNFANTLGHRELARLDTRGYLYRIPPPGAIVQNNIMKASVEFPGLEIQVSTDEGTTWTRIPPEGISKPSRQTVLLRTKAAASERYSRVVKLE